MVLRPANQLDSGLYTSANLPSYPPPTAVVNGAGIVILPGLLPQYDSRALFYWLAEWADGLPPRQGLHPASGENFGPLRE